MQEIEYDEYGNMMKNTNPGFQPLTFAGGLYDSDTKLIRFGARDYDPTVGRWTVKDPIGFAGGDTNLYGYVGQNPMSYIDPTGEASLLTRAGRLCIQNPDMCASLPDLINPPPLQPCDPFGWGVDKESCKNINCQIMPNSPECRKPNDPSPPKKPKCNPNTNCCNKP